MVSRARKTEERRENLIQAAVAEVVGETEAKRLMRCLQNTPHPMERDPETLNAYWKIERLSLTASGREQLTKIKQWSDLESI